MIYKRSSALFAEAEKVIPGGVNSPVRAFKGVGGTPIFVKSAKGAYLFDEDGNVLKQGVIIQLRMFFVKFRNKPIKDIRRNPFSTKVSIMFSESSTFQFLIVKIYT